MIHRQALQLWQAFADQVLTISSPQGRFSEAARLLNGAQLVATRAHGKHLFLGFSAPPVNTANTCAPPTASSLARAEAYTATWHQPKLNKVVMARAEDWDWDKAARWVHIHLGLYGKWRWHSFEADPLDPVGQVRLRLVGDHQVADLSGPNRCELVGAEEAQAIINRLGPDPLDPQPADKERFIDAVRARSRAVGELVMDQSVVAGPGNIYRAECLFHVGISPFRPGNRVSRLRLARLWDDLVENLERGRREGVIVTMLDADRPRAVVEGDEEAQRFYVYHRSGRACLRCGARIGEQPMAGRRLFWCPGCQR